MPRKKSNFICPICHMPGPKPRLSNDTQKKRIKSEKTTIFPVKTTEIMRKDNLNTIPILYTETRYPRVRIKHWDNANKEQYLCEIPHELVKKHYPSLILPLKMLCISNIFSKIADVFERLPIFSELRSYFDTYLQFLTDPQTFDICMCVYKEYGIEYDNSFYHYMTQHSQDKNVKERWHDEKQIKISCTLFIVIDALDKYLSPKDSDKKLKEFSYEILMISGFLPIYNLLYLSRIEIEKQMKLRDEMVRKYLKKQDIN